MGNFILMYSGSIDQIPPHFYLCDGTNGTPDLTNKFVKGCFNNDDLGQVGGSDSHNHLMVTSGNAHTHSVTSGGEHYHTTTYYTTRAWSADDDSGYATTSDGHTSSTSSAGAHTHTITDSPNLPPYYTLAFIMAEKYNIDIPIGGIVMWTGDINDLPDGFVFCDGQNGTPDLRDRFIMGTKNDVGITGGSSSHTHTLNNTASHTHTIQSTTFNHIHEQGSPGGNIVGGKTFGLTEAGQSHTHTMYSGGEHTHTLSEVSLEPSYVKLAYIMKVA